MASTSQVVPTFHGHISSTYDALLVFEACLGGRLAPLPCRPSNLERAGLIRSGNVFVYEETSSGVKRWTDGVPWSPSRMLGNFLIYRELDASFRPGAKRRANKRSKSSGISEHQPNESLYKSNPISQDVLRSLVGSLTTSYAFKVGGLVKKTISVTVGGLSHRLVSYYSIADILDNKFTTPSKDPTFQHITPRLDLAQHHFRWPLVE
ncbi:Gti1/Pac2 family-domain-containing protein, partial [Amylocarpus encephaloides]